MKRIMENVAVQTILYTMNPFQKIRIYDYENDYDMGNDPGYEKGKCVFSGLVKDAHHYNYTKVERSKCYGIDLKDGEIIFKIYTKFEQY